MIQLTPCLIVLYLAGTINSVKVCKSFADYYKPLSKNCFDNLDSDGNVTDIIKRWGFLIEQHHVTTDDGYKLTLFRINSDQISDDKPPVLFGHGIKMNSLALIATKNKSLAHRFAANGYDVWLANFRGTKFSKEHTKLSSKDRAYWNFSFHEMATKDLPKILQLINNKTNKKVLYIGFSMGTTISYIYSSIYNEMASESLLGIISLAPVAYLAPTKSAVMPLAYVWPFFEPLINIVSKGNILSTKNTLNFCMQYPYQMKLCEIIKIPIWGYGVDQIDPITYPVSAMLNPETISNKVISHYLQILRKKRFQQFDYGVKQNQAEYGELQPPIYDIKKIQVPVVLFVGRGDWLATHHNAKRLYKELPDNVQCGYHLINYKTFNHPDFIRAKDIVPFLENDLLQSASDLVNGLCGNATTSSYTEDH